MRRSFFAVVLGSGAMLLPASCAPPPRPCETAPALVIREGVEARIAMMLRYGQVDEGWVARRPHVWVEEAPEADE